MPDALKFVVPFDEADGEGIVFFGNYFRMAHRALEQWVPSVGIAWKDWFDHPEWGAPLRHVEADYLKPLRPGDEFTVNIRVKEIGESSVHFVYEFSASGTPCARLQTTHVFIDRKTARKMSVPAGIRQRLPTPLAE